MKLRVVWAGKTKNPQMAKLCQDYIGRIKHFLPMEIAELKEAKKILPALDSSDRVVVLDVGGKPWRKDNDAPPYVPAESAGKT